MGQNEKMKCIIYLYLFVSLDETQFFWVFKRALLDFSKSKSFEKFNSINKLY